MSLLNNFTRMYKSDLQLLMYPSYYMVRDIVALSEFDCVVSYMAIRAKIISDRLYSSMKTHRTKVFR